MLTAKTRSPLSELISMMVLHVSYKMALPTFLLLSVFVATCAKMSFITSLASSSWQPSSRSNFNILVYREIHRLPEGRGKLSTWR